MGMIDTAALRLSSFAATAWSSPNKAKQPYECEVEAPASGAPAVVEGPPTCLATGEFDWSPQLAALSVAQSAAPKPAGVDLARLVEGDVVELETMNREYVLFYLGRGEALLSGHPDICPKPTPALVYGSSWDGRNLRLGFVGSGLCLEFSTADHPFCRTSRIETVRVRD